MHPFNAIVVVVILLQGTVLYGDDAAFDAIAFADLPAVVYVDPVESLSESFGQVLEEPLVDVPLRDLVPVVTELSGIPCRIAANHLDDVDLSPDTVVSLSAGVPLYMALDRMCRETPDLEWVIDLECGEIVISSERECERVNVDFAYDIGDLSLDAYPRERVPNWDFNNHWVEWALEAHTGVLWFNIDGLGGEIERTDNYLGINHHFRAQRKIDALLSALRLRGMIVRVDQPPESAAIDQALEQLIDVQFEDVILEEAVASLSEQTGIEIQIDPRILRRHPYLSAATISWSSNGQTLRDALVGILDSAEIPRFTLGYCVVAGAIWITFDYDTQETMVYNVEDLLPNTGVRTLKSRITEEANGQWLERDGTGGDISPTPYGYFIITQTRRVHYEVADLLSQMRSSAAACGN